LIELKKEYDVLNVWIPQSGISKAKVYSTTVTLVLPYGYYTR